MDQDWRYLGNMNKGQWVLSRTEGLERFIISHSIRKGTLGKSCMSGIQKYRSYPETMAPSLQSTLLPHFPQATRAGACWEQGNRTVDCSPCLGWFLCLYH